MALSQIYLVSYNAIQFIGWLIIMVKTAMGLMKGSSNKQLHELVRFELLLFQSLMVLEIFHAMLRLVKSPVSTTVKQVFSRVSVVWLVLYKVPLARYSYGVPLILIAWSITEVVRYSFYAFTLINRTPHFLKWMRYTFFILLYPMGALGEVLIILAALPEVAVKKHFTVEMPNAANFGFSFWYYLVLFAGIYPFGFPQMYLYMFKQREKVLHVEASKKRE